MFIYLLQDLLPIEINGIGLVVYTIHNFMVIHEVFMHFSIKQLNFLYTYFPVTLLSFLCRNVVDNGKIRSKPKGQGILIPNKGRTF